MFDLFMHCLYGVRYSVYDISTTTLLKTRSRRCYSMPTPCLAHMQAQGSWCRCCRMRPRAESTESISTPFCKITPAATKISLGAGREPPPDHHLLHATCTRNTKRSVALLLHVRHAAPSSARSPSCSTALILPCCFVYTQANEAIGMLP